MAARKSRTRTEPTPQGKRTEHITREYDGDGELVVEISTVVTTLTPKADDKPWPGGYL